MKTTTAKIKDLKVNPGNPRIIKDDKFRKLVKSIQDFPEMLEIRPIVVNADNVILGGNMRLRACQEAGLKEVPIIRAEDLTEEQQKEFIVKDNLPYGEWDWDILANEWDDLKLEEWGMDVPGGGIDESQGNADAEPQIDRAEELNKTWKVQAGDLYQIGEHRLLCGDSAKETDTKFVMNGKSATLIFTDPPYGVSIGKKNVMLNTFQPSGRCLNNLDMDDMPPKELGEMLLKVFKLWRDYMADDCSVFVCSPQGGGLGMMMMMMMDAGLEVRHILNWVKNSPTFSMGRLDYDYQHEPILFTWKKTHKRKKEGQFQTSLWAVDKPRSNKEHPTMKPIELPECAILNHTDSGDIVSDMFLGSGTTMVAAQNLNRKCYGIEISPDYCAVILQRMTDAFPGIEIKKINFANPLT